MMSWWCHLYTSVSYHYCALLASWSSQCIEMHSWPIQAAHDVTHRAQYMCVFMLNSLACLHSATLKGYTALMATLMLFPSWLCNYTACISIWPYEHTLHWLHIHVCSQCVSHSALHLFYTAPLFMPPSANLKGPDAWSSSSTAYSCMSCAWCYIILHAANVHVGVPYTGPPSLSPRGAWPPLGSSRSPDRWGQRCWPTVSSPPSFLRPVSAPLAWSGG